MKCADNRKCKQSAVGIFTWGPTSNPQENNNIPLCSDHLDRLWSEIKKAVQRGEMFYAAKSIPENLK